MKNLTRDNFLNKNKDDNHLLEEAYASIYEQSQMQLPGMEDGFHILDEPFFADLDTSKYEDARAYAPVAVGENQNEYLIMYIGTEHHDWGYSKGAVTIPKSDVTISDSDVSDLIYGDENFQEYYKDAVNEIKKEQQEQQEQQDEYDYIDGPDDETDFNVAYRR